MRWFEGGIDEYCNEYRKPKLCMTEKQAKSVVRTTQHGSYFLCKHCGAYHVTRMDQEEFKAKQKEADDILRSKLVAGLGGR